MRLLRTSTSKPTLELFGSTKPPYAILSHTWDKDEILFQDLMDDTRRNTKKSRGSAGWQKLEASRRFAYERGFEYIWNDTCCIDKESSADITESINSMYKYYAESSLCIAYLSDVPGGLEEPVRREKFKRSRWFTRGWTLQELLAPLNLIFVDAEWVEMGSKSNMEELVRETTGISLEGLREPLSPNISVAAKMSWASQRGTTREEDMAYCLMGLFNVNMPSLYGEGCYNAFLRLQLEIIKQSNDRSIFAWRALSNNLKHRGLLANSPQEFIDSGTVRFTGGAQLEFPKEQNHDPQDNTRCLMALLLCLLGGCCCSYIVLFSDSQEQSRRSKAYKVDPTYNMNNANLHIHFPFHQLGTGSEKISVYLGCFIDDSPIWIRVVNVGNNQFQRIEMDRFVQPQTHRGPHRPEEMYFQQPVLDRCTSRMWMNFAQRTMFILPQSIKSIGTYSFMRHAEWHPEHSASSGRFFHNTFQVPYPSWCLPFHDPIHQRGFVISIRVDSRHRMFCGVSSVASVPAEVDMLAVSKYYWERCMLGSARDRENHGDRAFFVIEEGIVSVLVRNITENFAWEDAINTAIFAVDISLINDSALRPVLCVPPALDPNSSTDLVLQMDLNQDCQLTLHRKKAKQIDLGNNVKILSVPRDNLPILMTFHGSFGQVGVILGLSYENIWVDIITDPEFGDGENFPNHKKINDTYVRSEIPKARGQDCVSGEWVLSNASGRFTRQEILVRTGKITSPYQFGSFTVSVHIDTVHVGKYSTA